MRLPRRRTPGQPHPPATVEPDDRPRRRTRLVMGVAGVVAVAVAGVGAYVVLGADEQPEQAAPIFSTGSTFVEVPESLLRPDRSDSRSGPRKRRDRAPVEPGPPRRLVIPALGVDSAIVPITSPGGVLTPPDDGQEIGWWSPGAEPGAEVGSALMTWHTFSRGGAALQDLETLEAGDAMAVRTADGRIRYRVSDVRVFPKGTVAAEAGELFSQSAPGRLVVVTCEDYDGSRFLSNVVVTATPVGRSSATF